MKPDCDLLILGSGAAGLSAAVTAAHHGLKVIVVEKSDVLGGTTAWSGGWIWAPRNPLAKAAGIDEPPEAPETYLKAVCGNFFDAARVNAFLKTAPRMVAFFQDHTTLQFESGSHIPDTYGHLPGAGTGARSVIAAPYDARKLGPALSLLRKPLRETSFMGMTIQAGPDLRAFMTMTRSLPAFIYVTRRFLHHLYDLLRYGRGMQLRNGNALIGRLLRSALDLGVTFQTRYTATSLVQQNAQITGASFQTPAGLQTIQSRLGVILATGGAAHDSARQAKTLRDAEAHLTLAVPDASGDGLRLAETIGAQSETSLAAPSAYCPVSEVIWPDGSAGRFPHIIERGKPGIIGVLKNGKRFCNEALGYHDYVTALMQATPQGETLQSWLICDHRFQRRYGLGIARPSPLPLWPWVKSGYLKKGSNIAELAIACGIDPAGLAQTIRDWNTDAATGADPAFGRGSTPYQRLQGDASQTPNPCVRLIGPGPFYAVRVVAGSFGIFNGLKTDARTRVLDAGGTPIPGLFAAGTDMASVFGGHYPAGGINLGPAMTFGHLAALEAAGLTPQDIP